MKVSVYRKKFNGIYRQYIGSSETKVEISKIFQNSVDRLDLRFWFSILLVKSTCCLSPTSSLWLSSLVALVVILS